jgi:hypothetical protein
MPSSNNAARPLIEITLSRTALRRCAVILPLSLILILGMVGATVSPLVNQHPVLLTRERLAIMRYRESAQGWIQRLDEIALRLETLSSEPIATSNNAYGSTAEVSITSVPTGALPSEVDLPAQAPLSVFNAPAGRPDNLFDRAQAAEYVIQDLQALERDMQQIEIPVAFTGLHTLAVETMRGFADWSTQVADTIGAPTSDSIVAAQAARQAALITLENLRQALARQQGTQP